VHYWVHRIKVLDERDVDNRMFCRLPKEKLRSKISFDILILVFFLTVCFWRNKLKNQKNLVDRPNWCALEGNHH